MLKNLWDTIGLVKSSFAEWNTTLWKDINVEQMEMDCKKFVKVCTPVHVGICLLLEGLPCVCAMYIEIFGVG